MEEWNNDMLECWVKKKDWNDGILEYWEKKEDPGTMEEWNAGMMGERKR